MVLWNLNMIFRTKQNHYNTKFLKFYVHYVFVNDFKLFLKNCIDYGFFVSVNKFIIASLVTTPITFLVFFGSTMGIMSNGWEFIF